MGKPSFLGLDCPFWAVRALIYPFRYSLNCKNLYREIILHPKKSMNIETERIVIREFQKKDAAGLLEYLSNPRVNCFAGDRLCSEEAAWAYIQYSQKICNAMP